MRVLSKVGGIRLPVTWTCVLLVGERDTEISGLQMPLENKRRDIAQGVQMKAADVDTAVLAEGYQAPAFRYMY